MSVTARTMKLLVSLNKASLRQVVRENARFDIGEMIKPVPSATIVSGNPRVAVQVEVEPIYADLLRAALDGICTIGPYRELEVFGNGLRTGRGFARATD